MKRTSLSLLIGAICGIFYFTRNVEQLKHKHGILTFGNHGTEEFRVFLTDGTGKSVLSFWHDIPVTAGNDAVHMVVEIPRLAREKMEIHKTEPMNPIFHDKRNGKLRFLHSPLSWHYGSAPQTLGDDGDPLDVLDISDTDRKLGDIVGVKILGALPLLDEGHFDWKIIAVDVNDPLAEGVHSLEDLERVAPGVVSGIEEFFRWYDFPETKRPNKYAGGILGREGTAKLIEEAHEAWAAKYKPASDLSE